MSNWNVHKLYPNMVCIHASLVFQDVCEQKHFFYHNWVGLLCWTYYNVSRISQFYMANSCQLCDMSPVNVCRNQCNFSIGLSFSAHQWYNGKILLCDQLCWFYVSECFFTKLCILAYCRASLVLLTIASHPSKLYHVRYKPILTITTFYCLKDQN